MRCEWKKCSLGSLMIFKNGRKRPETGGLFPVYGGNGILGFADKWNNENCVVIGRVGAYCGSVFLEKGKCWISDNAISGVSDSDDIEYLFYLLKYLQLNQRHIGTSQPLLTQEILNNIQVTIPPNIVQRKFAEILCSLDEKIELNNKINENLERQARALLSQWLIENDGSYKFATLFEVAVINPDTYSPKDAWEYVNYLDTSSITDGLISEVQYIKPSTEKLPSRARRIIVANDVVFSTVRPNQRHFGIISKPLDHMLASTGFAVIRSNHPSVCNELLYLCLTKEDFIEKMQQLAEQSTSTFPSIKPTDLGGCKIPCPISEELTMNLKAVFDCIASNHIENQTLARIRDTILPKLMNGEIEIDEI